MSPWTALLESLHSSLIDELTDRHPEPKPELGMPIRMNAFVAPSAELQTALVSLVVIQSQLGLAVLAFGSCHRPNVRAHVRDAGRG